VALLELPEKLAAFGIHTLELCHFHLPSTDAGYLGELRGALASAEVELFALLVDGGDLTDPQHGARDAEWIGGWLEVAARLGAARSRVIAGKAQPSAAAIQQSVARLRQLADQAEALGLRLTTENWLGLMATPAQVEFVLDQLAGRLGLCADFGNWSGPEKYRQLAEIMPRAESCHAKAHFTAEGIDQADYVRCLEITRDAQFDGPYTLIYDGPDGDEWAGLATERALVAGYL
jgi:sugar phosphate isomerase/epimerase